MNDLNMLLSCLREKMPARHGPLVDWSPLCGLIAHASNALVNVVDPVTMQSVQESVHQSRLSSQLAFQCWNLPQLLNAQKKYHFISICISIFNLEVLKIGFKWGMIVTENIFAHNDFLCVPGGMIVLII